MAATNAVLSLIKPGQRVVVSDNVYGGTHRLFTKVLAQYGVEFAFLDASDAGAFDKAAGRVRDALDRDPDQPADEGLRHRGPGRRPRTGAARSSSWTTRSCARTFSGRSSWAPTW